MCHLDPHDFSPRLLKNRTGFWRFLITGRSATVYLFHCSHRMVTYLVQNWSGESQPKHPGLRLVR